jgi:hypothetical protein
MIDIRAKCLEWGNQWGQTYTFDKMWIIDRSLLTLEKYDLENNWGQTYTFDIMPCFHKN